MKWITRAPATIEEVKELLNTDLDFIPGTDPRYAFYAADLNYGGISQRAVVVWSEEMKIRNEQTFDKMIQKETDAALKDLKKLMSKKFACVPDAENEAINSSHRHEWRWRSRKGRRSAMSRDKSRRRGTRRTSTSIR